MLPFFIAIPFPVYNSGWHGAVQSTHPVAAGCQATGKHFVLEHPDGVKRSGVTPAGRSQTALATERQAHTNVA